VLSTRHHLGSEPARFWRHGAALVSRAVIAACAAGLVVGPAGAQGAGFGSPVTVSGWTDGSNYPGIVAAAPGTALAYWDKYPPQPWDGAPHPSVIAQAVSRSGAGDPVTLDSDAYDAVGASDSAGDASVAWVHGDGYVTTEIRLADYSPQTGFGPFQTIAAENGIVNVARNDHGDTLVVYEGQSGEYSQVWARFRPVGGSFGPAVQLNEPSTILVAPPSVSLAEDGSATMAWEDWPPGTNDQRAVVVTRAPAGSYSAPLVVSGAGEIAEAPTAAAGPGGGAVVAWQEYAGSDPSTNYYGPRDFVVVARAPGGDFGSPRQLGHTGYGAPGGLIQNGSDAMAVFMDVGSNGNAHVLETSQVSPANGTIGSVRILEDVWPGGVAGALNRFGAGILLSSDRCSGGCTDFGAWFRSATAPDFGGRQAIWCPAPPWPAGATAAAVDATGDGQILYAGSYERSDGTWAYDPPALVFEDDNAQAQPANCTTAPSPVPPATTTVALPASAAMGSPGAAASLVLDIPSGTALLLRNGRELTIRVRCPGCLVQAVARVTGIGRLVAVRSHVRGVGKLRFRLRARRARRVLLRELANHGRVRAVVRVQAVSGRRSAEAVRVLTVRRSP
jgi:hypothetical protein